MLIFFGIIIFTAFWFFDQIFGGYLFCFMDLTRYFYPYKYFMVEAVKSGFFPLWNPYIYSGFPFFAALQAGVLYPISILFYLLPFDHAFNWFIIVHYPLAFFFMYIMLREFKLSKASAVVGGLSFAYSGYLNSVLHMPTSLSSVIWLPLAVMFFYRLINSFKFANLLFASMIFGLMFLGGEPTVYYGTVLFFLGYLFFKFIYEKNPAIFIKRIGALAAAVVLSFSLTAVQLIPFIELIMNSVRAKGITFIEASHWSLAPRDLVSLAVPYFYNLTPFPFVNTEWLKVPYLGTISILLALIVVAYKIRSDRKVQILSAAFILSIIIAMGSFTPIYFLLFKYLPGFSLIRYPVKFLFLTTFILSFLSAFGMDLILKKQLKRKIFQIIIVCAVLSAIVCSFLFFNMERTISLLKPIFQTEINSGFYNYLPGIMGRNIVNIIILCLFVIGFSLINLFKDKINIKLFVFSMVLLVALDLMISNKESVLSIKMPEYHKVPPIVSYLKGDRDIYRVFTAPTMGDRSQTEVASEFKDYGKALYAMRDRIPPNQNMLFNIQILDAYESIKGANQDAVINKINYLNSLQGIRLLDMLNIKYLVSPWPLKFSGFTLIKKEKELVKQGNIYLYKNNNCLPRAFVVPEARVMPKEKMLDYMASPRFFPEREILLEEIPDNFIPKIGSKIGPKILSYKSNEVIIAVSGPGMLFLSDSYYPGWQAFIDNKESKVYRANFMFRAVVLTKGEHVVRFVYNPMTFKIGLIISIISAVLMFLVFVYKVKR